MQMFSHHIEVTGEFFSNSFVFDIPFRLKQGERFIHAGDRYEVIDAAWHVRNEYNDVKAKKL